MYGSGLHFGCLDVLDYYNVGRLILSCGEYMVPCTRQEFGPKALSNLRVLELDGEDLEYLLDFLLTCQDLPPIHTVKLGHPYNSDVLKVSQFLQRIKSSLRHLAITGFRSRKDLCQGSFWQSVNLGTITELRTIQLGSWNILGHVGRTTRIVDLIALINSVHMEEMSIVLEAVPEHKDRQDTIEKERHMWSGVDDALLDAGFPNLRKVTFVSRRASFWEKRRSVVEEELPRCHKQGLLSFEIDPRGMLPISSHH